MVVHATHTLLGSLDELLAPATLSRLSGRPVTGVRRLPFSSVDGRSGGQLETVEAEGAGRYVLKRISWRHDATMRLTDDRFGRAVVIWQNGLLARLPPQITHGVVACARDGDGWALLLEDFRGQMLPDHEQRSTEENNIVLDAMAALHETFWDEPASTVDTHRLCSLRARYEILFPHSLRSETDSGLPIVPYALEGWELLPELVEPAEASSEVSLPTAIAAPQLPVGGFLGSLPTGNLVARGEEMR